MPFGLIRTRARAHIVLGVAALLCTMAIASSAQAVTYEHEYYCGWGVAAYSTCSSTPGYALWVQNNAAYGGAGTISVCQKAVLSNGTNATRTCGNNYVNAGGELGYYYNQGIATTPRVGNNS